MRDDELNRIDGEVCLKERGEYSVLALYSDADGINLSKTRKDFANEVWGERMFGGVKKDGMRRGEVEVQARDGCWGGLRERGVRWGRLFRGGLGTTQPAPTRTRIMVSQAQEPKTEAEADDTANPTIR